MTSVLSRISNPTARDGDNTFFLDSDVVAGVGEAAADAAEDVDEDDAAEERLEPSSNTMMMLHCLFAMVFAAATLGLMNCLGLVVRSGNCCPTGSGYSRCDIWQDFRSVLSFVFGALLCCVFTSERSGSAESNGKVQLYTCLL